MTAAGEASHRAESVTKAVGGWRAPVPPTAWQAWWAIYAREMKRMKSATGFILLPRALTTLLLIAVFELAAPGGLAGSTQALPDGIGLGSYLAPGLAALGLMTASFEMTAFMLLHAKLEGYIEADLMAPLGALPRVAAYSMAGITAGLVTAVLIVALTVLLVDVPFADPGIAIAFTVGGAWALAMCGVIAGLWSTKWDSLSAISTFVVMPLMFLSGTFAPVDGLAEPLASILAASPTHFVVDGVRAGLAGVAATDLVVGGLVVLGLSLLATVAAQRLVATGYRTQS